jgi:hypothetical protein
VSVERGEGYVWWVGEEKREGTVFLHLWAESIELVLDRLRGISGLVLGFGGVFLAMRRIFSEQHEMKDLRRFFEGMMVGFRRLGVFL